ncbi:MAG TPA: DUF4339 domain-containing protein, partial [Planctomycetaceae bacterium]|nr:DUF4339 domain-containing protein [Planctomycetaceae bacterium]
MDQWHIARGKVKKGPYSFSQLQKAAAKGSIHATDQVLQPGAQEWVAARQVSGLFPAPPAKPADAIPAEIPVATGAKPVSPIAAVGISEEETAISPPKKSDWLQTTRGLLGRFGGKPEANPELHGAAGRRSRVWLGVAGAGIGLCLLVVVSFVIFGGKSGAVVGDKSGPGVGSKSGPSQTVDSPASGSPDVELPPKTVAAPAIKPPQLELPPVGPTKPPARDVVMQEFKAARAEYRAALTKARDDLRAQYPSIKAQIEKSNLDPREKATSLKRLLDEQGKFTQVESSGGGPIHTHPAMQPAVAEYVQARKSAARKFGEVADKGLIAYEKAGVTDEAKLRPLQAARLVGEHPDLIGIWEGTPGQGQRPMFVTQTVQEVWHIGVDEHTGGWLISGYEAQYGFAPRAAYLGEHIEFKDGVLTFNALPVDEEHTKPRQLFPTAPPAQGGAPGFGNAPGLGGRAAPKSAPPPSRVRKEAAKAKPAV